LPRLMRSSDKLVEKAMYNCKYTGLKKHEIPFEDTIEWYKFQVPKVDVAEERTIKVQRLYDMLHMGMQVDDVFLAGDE